MTQNSVLQQVLAAFSRKEIVKIRDVGKVEKLLSGILDGGPGSLQIITDFDQTLTRYHQDGKICDSCYGIFDRSPRMSEHFKATAKTLFDKYRPIEVDASMSVAEKIPHMINWYMSSMAEMIECHIDKPLIKTLVEESRAFLRDNAKEMLETLHKAHIPVLIFSAGIGDVLEEILHKNEIYYPNIKIVSNYMNYKENGALQGFKEPIIHTFNKNESVLGEDSYFLDLAHRGNAILMGDSDGDVDMASGMHDPGTILKIGFLNTNIENRLDLFMDKFDIVLLDDQSMDFVNLLLDQILKAARADIVHNNGVSSSSSISVN